MKPQTIFRTYFVFWMLHTHNCSSYFQSNNFNQIMVNWTTLIARHTQNHSLRNKKFQRWILNFENVCWVITQKMAKVSEVKWLMFSGCVMQLDVYYYLHFTASKESETMGNMFVPIYRSSYLSGYLIWKERFFLQSYILQSYPNWITMMSSSRQCLSSKID